MAKQAATKRAAEIAAAGVTVGYARSSTTDQVAGFEAQQRDLRATGATRLFTDMVSSVAKREQLEAALDYVRAGDTLVVTKLDRLARSTADLLAIVTRLEAKGVALRVMAMAGGGELDTRTPTGSLMLTMLGAIAEFERALMLERQREGIKAAKDAGRYKGRAPTARRQAADVSRLHREGMRPTDIATRLGMSRSSVYRVLEGVAGPAAA